MFSRRYLVICAVEGNGWWCTRMLLPAYRQWLRRRNETASRAWFPAPCPASGAGELGRRVPCISVPNHSTVRNQPPFRHL